jgi:hypothetical protein
VASTIECDGCHAVFDFKKKPHLEEIREFISLHRETGPASIAGPGKEVHMDLCQTCFKALLGSLVTVKDPASGKSWQGLQADPPAEDVPDKAEENPVEADQVEEPQLMQFPGQAISGNPQEQ